MNFVIITHVNHIHKGSQYLAYAPYVREMNIWLKYVDEVKIVGPLIKKELTAIETPYEHDKINFVRVPSFSFTSFKNNLVSVFKLPLISWKIFWAMKKADHIHLRCPGNMGLVGCLIQMSFPHKMKTAKYAGNWDPQSKQPWTYNLQKWILSNTFLTRNMQVLVYGNWKNQSENIKPFFTATYSEADKKPIVTLGLEGVINFIFVGTLVVGKNPLYAIQLVESLLKKGYNVSLDLYGEGIQRKVLENYIKLKGLENNIQLQGNQNQETIKKAYQKSHFVILPSQSEGWPKAIAEGMFWGCIPVATKVSCVPFMLDYGGRGVLLNMNLEEDAQQIEMVLKREKIFTQKREKASDWSRKYTLDIFETEIKKMLL